MSDTPAEIRDHLYLIYKAEGEVLLAGLGLGMVLQALINKDDLVRSITVIEKDAELIQFVEPHYRAKFPEARFEIINADIFNWFPKGRRFDVAWFDIWDEISDDNYEEMKFLRRRWGRRINAFHDCWGRDQIVRDRRYGW